MPFQIQIMSYRLAEFSDGLAQMRGRILNGTYLDKLVERAVVWGVDTIAAVCAVTFGGLCIVAVTCVCLIKNR